MRTVLYVELVRGSVTSRWPGLYKTLGQASAAYSPPFGLGEIMGGTTCFIAEKAW